MVSSVAGKVLGLGLAAVLVASLTHASPQGASAAAAAPGQYATPSRGPIPRLDAFSQHVLERTGYGPDRWSQRRIAELGAEGYIREQLNPQSIDDSAFEARLAGYASLSMSYEDLRNKLLQLLPDRPREPAALGAAGSQAAPVHLQPPASSRRC